MGTVILNKKKAVDFKPNPTQYNVLVRVTDPRSEFLSLKYPEVYQDILTMRFYDMEDESSGLYLFTDTHLELLLEYFEKHKNCHNMIIHCDEGRSRSAGIAVGWFLFHGNRSSVYKLYHDGVHYPNRRIVNAFYHHFGLNTKMIDRWEEEIFG